MSAPEPRATPTPLAASFERTAAAHVSDLPGASLESFAAMFNLVRTANRMINDLETKVHRQAGWSWAGFRVMFTIWVSGPLEPRRIARLASISRAAVSSVLNTLERDGLVERARDQGDRRLVTVRLTDDGRKRLEHAYTRQNTREQELLSPLDPQELATFTDLLRRLLHAH
ncbi:MAG: MarR family winged helix-turn-helix transcriptional regulator [Acidimicrobiales bacterium]